MATINSMMNSTYSTQSKTASSAKSDIKDLQQKMSDLDRNSSLSSTERAEQKKNYQAQIDTLKSSIKEETDSQVQSISSNSSNLVSSMFGSSGNASAGQTGFDFFFGASASLSSLKAVNTARMNIENRARTLTSEIAMDKMRGIDISGKQESLANLTANLTVMDSSLSNNINSALDSEPKATEKTYKPVIEKINDSLASNQAKLDAKREAKEVANNKATEADKNKTS